MYVVYIKYKYRSKSISLKIICSFHYPFVFDSYASINFFYLFPNQNFGSSKLDKSSKGIYLAVAKQFRWKIERKKKSILIDRYLKRRISVFHRNIICHDKKTSFGWINEYLEILRIVCENHKFTKVIRKIEKKIDSDTWGIAYSIRIAFCLEIVSLTD